MIEHLLNFEIHAHKMTNNTVISNILHILRKRGYKKSLRGGFSKYLVPITAIGN